jgi:hypothetical protein
MESGRASRRRTGLGGSINPQPPGIRFEVILQDLFPDQADMAENKGMEDLLSGFLSRQYPFHLLYMHFHVGKIIFHQPPDTRGFSIANPDL